MTSVFETIKETAPIVEVAQHYGLSVNRAGFTLCPLHGEKSPSLKLYPNTNTFHCFGCGAGTSVIDLTAALQGVPPIQAAKHLDAMYSLRLFNDKPLTAQERRKIAEDARRRERDKSRLKTFEAWEMYACRTVAEYLRILDEWKRYLAPKTPEDDINPLFVEACHKLDYYDYLYTEIFINGDFAAKAEFYKTHSGEVDTIAKRLDTIRKNRTT